MHGVISPLKPIVMEELRNGVASSVVSRKYGIALSTLTGWIKELPPDAKPSPFKSKNDKISVMGKVNRTEAKIGTLIEEYIICGITDEEWETLMKQIQEALLQLVLSSPAEISEIMQEK
jgi:transposase-like protein